MSQTSLGMRTTKKTVKTARTTKKTVKTVRMTKTAKKLRISWITSKT